MKNPFVYRPFSVIGIIVALHTIVIGYGFMKSEDVIRTPLFNAVEDLVPTDTFGLVGMVLGLALVVAYVLSNTVAVHFLSSIQTMYWIFITIAYFIADKAFLGLQNAVFWIFLSSYIALCFSGKSFWLDKR